MPPQPKPKRPTAIVIPTTADTGTSSLNRAAALSGWTVAELATAVSPPPFRIVPTITATNLSDLHRRLVETAALAIGRRRLLSSSSSSGPSKGNKQY